MSLELLYNCEKNKIHRKEDAVICCIHSCLISEGLKCIGSGEVSESRDEKRGSDMLPSGWSDTPGVYALRYQDEVGKDKYLLKAVVGGALLHVQLLRTSDEKVTNVEINSANEISDCLTSFETLYKNLGALVINIRCNLLKSFATPQPSQRPQQQHTQQNREDPLRADDHHRYRPPGGNDYRNTYPNPFAIGSDDLDPLRAGCIAGGTGGMLFDPFRQAGPRRGEIPSMGGRGTFSIPPGSVPPGARFDPFGPPDIGPRGGFRSGPDPDHMRKPDFNHDDMFM